MGHCLSCFQQQANTDNQTSHKKNDEMTEIITTNQVSAALDYHQAEPLLQPNENNINSYQLSKDCIPTTNIQHLHGEHYIDSLNPQKNQQSTEKGPKTLNINKKLPSIPLTIGSIEQHVTDTKINHLFDLYKDSSEDAILAEGIENLCNDLQLNPDDFKVLVLAWKLNASQMCRFTRSEFIQGMKDMKTDTIKGIQQKLNEITSDFKQDTDQFKDLYRFTFKFGLDVNSGQRILPVDIAIVLWRLVFTNNEPPILEKWLAYLEQNPHVRGIPKDTWYMFLNFCEFVGNDLSSYDDTEAWPSLFDDFVEFENDQMNQNITKNDFKNQ